MLSVISDKVEVINHSVLNRNVLFVKSNMMHMLPTVHIIK